MTHRLLLQNTLTFYKPKISKATGNLICSDDRDFINIMEDEFFLHSDTLRAVKEAFNSKGKTILLTAPQGTGKSTILRKFAFDSRMIYDAVIFISFDKDRYLFFDKSYDCSDNTILEKCISGIFMQSEYYIGRFNSNPFCSFSSTELLYSLAKRNALIIIDNLNTDSLPDFVFTLAEKGFNILLATQNEALASDKRVQSIHHIFDGKEYSRLFFEGRYSENTPLEKLCSLFSGMPEALHFIKCFLDSKKYTQSLLLQKVYEIIEVGGLTPSEDYIEIFYTLADFSSREKEILETAGVMLFYTNPAMDKTANSCFTAEHCEMYTGIPRKNLKRLIDLGFINVIGNDELYITTGVFRFIFNKLKPSAQSCSGFMKYISKCTSGKLSVLRKSYESSVHDMGKGDSEARYSFDASLFDVYSYFISSDDNSKTRLYKGFVQYALSARALGAMEKSTTHLFIRNRNVLIHSLCKALDEDFKAELYNGSDCEKYAPHIMAELNVIRICNTLIRFIHCDMYDDYRYIFQVMKKAINKLIEDISNSTYSQQKATQIYLDAITVCERTFIYFNDFCENGTYYPNRASVQSSLGYSSNYSWNEENASSLYILHSVQILKLFGAFYKLSSDFLSHITKREAAKLDENFANTYRLSREFCREFSSFLHRLLYGFDKFYNFYDEKLLCSDVYSRVFSMSDSEIEALLTSAKAIKQGFYDESSTQNSKNYCNEIISTITAMKSCEQAVQLILDASFPTSDKLTDMLEQVGFAKLIADKCGSDNHQRSRIFAFCSKQAGKKPSKLSFYTGIMTELCQSGEITTGAKAAASVNASLLFIKFVCDVSEKQIHFSYTSKSDEAVKKEILCSAETRFYLRFGNCNEKGTSCEQYLAQYIYTAMNHGKRDKKSLKPIKEVMDCFIYERLSKNCSVSRIGFAVLSGLLLGKEAAISTVNKMLDYDFTLQITKEDFEIILNYYKAKNQRRQSNEH